MLARVKPIDLRSDTVTKPTAQMREAMAAAEVGDDVYGEDPTVNALQERVARMLGKERALFFPSGTMANQACLHALGRPGEVVLASRDCHVLRFEAGAAAALSGLQIQALGEGGVFDGDDVREALHPDDVHYARIAILAIENTHNAAGGRIFPAGPLHDAVDVARKAGLAVHLDGARLWNASVASGRSPADLAAPFDTVSVCLSKGLGAPVGSVVAARSELLPAIHRARKRLGGGMRQAGLLAAAGLHALDHHVARLAEDHANARRLAEGLAELGHPVEGEPETNIVMFQVPDAGAFLGASRACGVLLNAVGKQRVRAVTHLDVGADDVEEALSRIAEIRRT